MERLFSLASRAYWNRGSREEEAGEIQLLSITKVTCRFGIHNTVLIRQMPGLLDHCLDLDWFGFQVMQNLG